jgi:hypothetical protein
MLLPGQAGSFPNPGAPRQGGLGTSSEAPAEDARLALPGTTRWLLWGAVGLGGAYVLSRASMVLRRHGATSRNPGCPLTDEWFGGMPECGGFSSATEYEIGAQRIAESTHCILGSLGKALQRHKQTPQMSLTEWLRVEHEHLHEEIGIISKTLEEYSRPLYSERLLPAYIETEYARWPDDAQRRLMYAKRTVASIKRTAPGLRRSAMDKMVQLDSCEAPKVVYDVAWNAYNVIVVLSEALLESVSEYPDSMGNAFQSNKMMSAFYLLRADLEKFFAATARTR